LWTGSGRRDRAIRPRQPGGGGTDHYGAERGSCEAEAIDSGQGCAPEHHDATKTLSDEVKDAEGPVQQEPGVPHQLVDEPSDISDVAGRHGRHRPQSFQDVGAPNWDQAIPRRPVVKAVGNMPIAERVAWLRDGAKQQQAISHGQIEVGHEGVAESATTNKER
jgi:hypothetical protein